MLSAIEESITFLIAWTLVVFATGYVFGRRRRGERDLSGPSRMGTSRPDPVTASQKAPPRAPLDFATRAEIDAALAAGQKIEAIKLLREATGSGLKEAKEAIEEGRF